MSRKLPALSARQVLQVLARAGFSVDRIKGSHHHLRHPGKPRAKVVVPLHHGDLPRGTLRAIIKQAGITEKEFLDLL